MASQQQGGSGAGPPSRGQGGSEWSSPPPTRAEWSSPPPPPPSSSRTGNSDWSPAPNRAEWSAPPTPRGLRANSYTAAGNNGSGNSDMHIQQVVNSNSNCMPPNSIAIRPETLETNALCVDKDKSTLKVHLPNGGFNVVKYGDATDIKVRLKLLSNSIHLHFNMLETSFQIGVASKK